ncbi:MAG: LysM peptidoglycan-binding domain-containing protein [Thermodesulfobacteriota bacterium]
MKRKTFLLTIFFAVFLLSPLTVHAAGPDIQTRRARRTEVPGKEGNAVSYVIIKHDTLWDISERFLRDPFKWPSIWKINPYIKNPDLIYPGDVVKIIPLEEEKKEEEFDVSSLPVVTVEPGAANVVVLEPEVKEEEKPAPPPVPHYSSSLMKKKGFIDKAGLKASGEIMKPRENVILLGDGDKVFISLKDKSGVYPGERYTIFNKSALIRHPVTGKKLGYMIDILGSLVVTENVGVVEGKIDLSFKEIEVGARLMPFTEPVSEVAMTETAPADLNGYIVATTEEGLDLSKGDIVYIDKGEKDGVKEGNVLDIYRFRKKVKDPVTGKKVDLPADNIGSLVVIKPGKRTSSCIITKSLTAVRVGYFVKTAATE